MFKSISKKIIFLIVFVLMFSVFTTACTKKIPQNGENITNNGNEVVPTNVPTIEPTTEPTKNPGNNNIKIPKSNKIEMTMADGGTMVFELYPQYAPKTVANFKQLVFSGALNGTKFHRIIKGFMVQGGAIQQQVASIPGEFASNGFKQNTLKHTKGVLSMARTTDPNSASSQFFIMDGTTPSLDGNYAAFGKLLTGEKTLDKIANTPVTYDQTSGEKSAPTEDVIVSKIVIVQ